jgi:hypothetical protein
VEERLTALVYRDILKQALLPSILPVFAPNLTPVCERCVLTYSHHFDVFYMERQAFSFLRLLLLQSFIILYKLQF